MPRTKTPKPDARPRGRPRKVVPITVASLAQTAPDGDGATSEAIWGRITALSQKYQPRRAKDDLYESLYHMERTGDPEEGEEQVISSKPFDVVNLATDLVSTNVPIVDVPPLSEKHADELEADGVEKFLLAIWHAWSRMSTDPIISQLGHDANLLGRFCARVFYVNDDDDEVGVPVRVQVRDPKYCFPEFDQFRRLWGMAEVYDRNAGEIRRAYPGVKMPTDSRGEEPADDEDVEWAEWWDARRYVYFVNGKEIWRDEHNMGRMPYVFRYGRYVRSDKPENNAVSILKGMESTAFAYDMMLSAKLTNVMNNVFGAWLFVSERGDQFKPVLKYGEVNNIFPNEDFKPVPRQGPMPDLEGMVDTLKNEMDNTSFRALMGQGDAASGYAFNQLTRGEKLKINPVKQSLDVGLAEIFELTLHLIGRGNKTVELYVPRMPGLTDYGFQGMAKITPQIARKYKQVFVSIPPDLLQDMQMNTSLALQATAGEVPLLDRDTARRVYMGQHDTTRIEQRIMEERLMKEALPVWYQQYLLPRMGIAQMQEGGKGQPQPQGQAVPPNGGQPVTTPDTPYVPDSMAGVPPTGQGDPRLAAGNAADQLMGQGLPPDMAMQLMASQGTPQASGRGR